MHMAVSRQQPAPPLSDLRSSTQVVRSGPSALFRHNHTLCKDRQRVRHATDATRRRNDSRDATARILLVRRRDEDTWGLPGGGLEAGESWRDAALRECRQEIGASARIDGLWGVYSDPKTQMHISLPRGHGGG